MDCDRNSRTELKTMIEDGGMGTVAGIASRWGGSIWSPGDVPDMILADLTLSAPKPLLTYRKSGRYCPDIGCYPSHVNDMDIIRMAYEKRR